MLDKLSGLHIAVPESRQLDVLKNLFERRGAQVYSCPLVSIHDSPDVKTIKTWLQAFISNTPDYFIILTGEGITRLSNFAKKENLYDDWQKALGTTFKLARGPKPNRALKPLGLQADALGLEPTTEGIIKSLDKINLETSRLSVQLYGDNPNTKLQDYLQSRNCSYDTVAPYIYASDSESDKVLALINAMADQTIDMICFTSQPQYKRLYSVAKQHNIENKLHEAMLNIKIIAVGPVVADQLQQKGYSIDFMPNEQFFMKPMVSSITDAAS